MKILFLIFAIGLVPPALNGQNIYFSPDSLALLLNETQSFSVKTNDGSGSYNILVHLSDSQRAYIDHNIDVVTASKPAFFNITAINPGHVLLNASSGDSTAYLHLTIQHSFELQVFSDVVGWIYFVAWSVSFYPQIYDNWKRKSVVGLNLDFLALNLVGFFLYSVFNGGLFWNEQMQREYQDMYPGSLNPVMVNDVVFSLHALLAVILTIAQCFFYERGTQSVSLVAKGILGIFAAFLLISAICAAASVLQWLQFLYFCSYVKLAITLIKYVPQAYMNYSRKSTVGWSIGNVFLDFTGGILSMLQMLVNAYNYDDWDSIFGDPTKFGLGLFSVIFDIFFLVQHYVLYRHGDSYDDFPASTTNSNANLVR